MSKDNKQASLALINGIKTMCIGKNDVVILPDSDSGRIVKVIASENITVYKIMKSDGSILYMEANKVQLGKQSRRNYMLTFSSEIINFLMYTVGIKRTKDTASPSRS
jgi:hypothetical protein